MKTKGNFRKVCDLVEAGFTISEALDELSIGSQRFYDEITSDQKMILDRLRISNRGKKNGIPYSDVDAQDLHEFFTNDYAF